MLRNEASRPKTTCQMHICLQNTLLVIVDVGYDAVTCTVIFPGSTHLLQCLLITPPRVCDHRGYFSEAYSRRRYAEMGINIEFVQDNHSLSRAVGTLRGLHYQAPPAAQGKLVRCGRGAIFDVAVDIRCGSPTYGQWEGYELNAENGHQLYVPVARQIAIEMSAHFALVER